MNRRWKKEEYQFKEEKITKNKSIKTLYWTNL